MSILQFHPVFYHFFFNNVPIGFNLKSMHTQNEFANGLYIMLLEDIII